jgi:Uma2 family endonuclease
VNVSRDETGLDSGLLDYLDEHELRYELIDGSIVVSPPPGFVHGDVLGGLYVQLRVGAPAGVAVLADYGFFYDDPSFLVPDFLVASREDCQEKGIYVAPLLVVEVLSKSTRRRDLGAKWDIYAEAGVPSYWLVDPREPSLTVLTLTDGGYVETDRITAGQVLRVEQPFPVDVALGGPGPVTDR